MTSRIRLSLRITVISVAILVTMPSVLLTNPASAQTENKQRLAFEIKNLQNINLSDLAPMIGSNNNSQPEPAAEPEIDPNIAILQSYLQEKGSPLAPYAEHILKHENWKLVLAISNGESTMCKRQMYNNCWGVGGAWNLKRYASFADGFTDVDRLITTKYVAEGKDTPEEIVRKYVGNPSPSWVRAVSQVLTQLDQLPLVN